MSWLILILGLLVYAWPDSKGPKGGGKDCNCGGPYGW